MEKTHRHRLSKKIRSHLGGKRMPACGYHSDRLLRMVAVPPSDDVAAHYME
jgi:hypothetical protein